MNFNEMHDMCKSWLKYSHVSTDVIDLHNGQILQKMESLKINSQLVECANELNPMQQAVFLNICVQLTTFFFPSLVVFPFHTHSNSIVNASIHSIYCVAK